MKNPTSRFAPRVGTYIFFSCSSPLNIRKTSIHSRERERGSMETAGFCSSAPLFSHNRSRGTLLTRARATQKPATRAGATKKGSADFPVGELGPKKSSSAPPVKLLTNVEKLRLLTKAEKAGLLSAAENFGFSLSTVERLGLLSKAEELGVLSAATDPGTPSTLLSISITLLVLGPLCVYIVPEQHSWEVALQVVVALFCVVGGSASFAASNFVANLQR